MDKTTSQYTDDNILLVPESLYSMSDVRVLFEGESGVIFYKDLQQELIDIEFFTNYPCLVYLLHGKETITTADNQQFKLGPGDLIFFAKGLNLYSDYLAEDGRLNAFLVFFSPQLIQDFFAYILEQGKGISNANTAANAIFKVPPQQGLKVYFESLLQLADAGLAAEEGLLKIKLLELLRIADLADVDQLLRPALLLNENRQSKRNIQRLLEKNLLSDLSVADLAELSGRSLASFNRDFKREFSTTPKKWLLERRLQHAYELVDCSEFSVTEIAMKIGYENVSHFIKAFKEKYGVTPKSLQQSL